MSRPHVYQTEVFILKRIDFGEADRLVTLYTPLYGKIRAIAKGVRRPLSRLAGQVELFTHSSLLIASGRNLDIITQGQIINSFTKLRGDLPRATYGYYLAELVDRLVADDIENQRIFRLLLDTYKRLNEGATDELLIRYFEIHLLDYLGYRPAFYECAGCGVGLTPVTNGFLPAAGGALCPTCTGRIAARPLSLTGLKVLRLLQSSAYGSLPRLLLSSEVLTELEALLQQYIRYYLEKDLKSLDFLQIIQPRERLAQQPGSVV